MRPFRTVLCIVSSRDENILKLTSSQLGTTQEDSDILDLLPSDS